MRRGDLKQLGSRARIAVTSRSFSGHPTLRAELASWFPQVGFNETGRTLEGDELLAFLRAHDAAIIATERIDAKLIGALPELRMLSKYGVGLDRIDLEALRAHGVALASTPGVNRRSVAELALTFALCLLRDFVSSSAGVKAGKWAGTTGHTLSGRVVGIVGLGNIGKELARLLVPFGCTIHANDVVSDPEFCRAHGVREVSLDELLVRSELVTLHVPLTEQTRNLIGREAFSRMRPGAFLINTSRGAVVDEAALLDALERGTLAGAASDVFVVEPPDNAALLQHPRFLATPHVGGSTDEAVLAMGRAAIEQLRAACYPAAESCAQRAL
jgi:D-3-phosphoglycerate dehydrogenase